MAGVGEVGEVVKPLNTANYYAVILNEVKDLSVRSNRSFTPLRFVQDDIGTFGLCSHCILHSFHHHPSIVDFLMHQ